MKAVLHTAGERGYADHGWLKTHHSFSFAGFFDPERMGFGALRVINDDRIEPGQGFGEHPHENMEIITIPLSGALAHADSMGNKEVLQTGEIQVMSAGTGVEHSEFNASQTEPVSLLQIWVLPDEPDVPPRYEQKKYEEGMNALAPVVGRRGEMPLGIHQQAMLSLGRFDRDASFEYALPKGRGAYIFVIEGSVKIEDFTLETRDALGLFDTDKFIIRVQKGAFILALEVPMA